MSKYFFFSFLQYKLGFYTKTPNSKLKMPLTFKFGNPSHKHSNICGSVALKIEYAG